MHQHIFLFDASEIQRKRFPGKSCCGLLFEWFLNRKGRTLVFKDVYFISNFMGDYSALMLFGFNGLYLISREWFV